MGATSPRNKVHKERDPERKPSIVSRSLTERVYSSNSDHATATALSTRARVLPGKTKGYRPLSITVSPGVRREGGYKNEAVLLAGTLGRGRNKAKQYRIAVPRALSEPVLGKRRPSERHARAPTFGRFRDSIPKSIVRTVPGTSESVDGAFTSSHQQQERSLSVELPKRYPSPVDSIPLHVNVKVLIQLLSWLVDARRIMDLVRENPFPCLSIHPLRLRCLLTCPKYCWKMKEDGMS